MTNQEHLLLGVLDWGLGHAARCVPLVQQWQAAGKRVTIASAGSALRLLRTSLVEVDFLELPAYAVRYPTASMVWNLAQQGPRILKVIREEYRIVRAYVAAEQVTTIVSDGRFGCYDKNEQCIWLAHQLQIQHSQPWLAGLMNMGYHTFVRKYFQEVWVPDATGANSLAGALSRPIARLPHTYLGALSRFSEISLDTPSSPRYQWLALLSGPEPQRTRLEKVLLQLLRALGVPALLVRGVAGSSTPRKLTPQLQMVDWLLGDKLQAAVADSRQIVCRSGYSTLMDAHYWRKPLLLIPTPGQTEQMYLARYWYGRGWAKWVTQGELSIAELSNRLSDEQNPNAPVEKRN